jgi:hypothetical protein
MAGRRTPDLSDEEKTRLGGEDALKAAQKAKPGDTELSGAAPGIKAKTDDSTVTADRVEPLEESRKAQTARRRADKRADEVREIQREVQSRNLLENVPPENVQTVFGTRDGDKDPDSITFSNVGNSVVVNATGEVTLTGDDRMALVRAVSGLPAGF